ncbi:HAD-IA family hydrolase [Azotobacter chroococcum]
MVLDHAAPLAGRKRHRELPRLRHGRQRRADDGGQEQRHRTDRAAGPQRDRHPLLRLPAHPEVREGLQALKNQGYTLVTLTNSTRRGVQTQLENAGLADLFADNLSIEEIKLYKPHLRTYRWAAERMGVKLEETLLVAAHGWDVAGAKAAGMPAIFVARPGQTLYPLAAEPDRTVKDIRELAAVLGKRP